MVRFTWVLRAGLIGAVVAAASAPWAGATRTATVSRVGGSRTALTQILGVLRQRQTPADRSRRLVSQLQALVPSLEDPGPDRLDRSLVRIAGTAPWGARIVLAAFITIPVDPRIVEPEMVGALVDGEIGDRAPATEIRRRGLIIYSEIWRHGGVHMVLVIPDRVARIAYLIPGRAPIYAAVQNNTAAFAINPTPRFPGQAESAATMRWYARDGNLIKRIPASGSTF